MERAGAVAVRQRVHHVIGEPGERDHGLHGRARRIGSAQRAVEQRTVDVVLQDAVLARGDAAAEHGGIEARQADERDHVAVVRIERHDRASMPGEGGLGGALHLQVDRQQQILAGSRRLGAQVGDERALALHRASLRVDQHLAKAVGAMQLRLVGALDTELADEGGAGVGGAVDVPQILLADGAHVAERVHRQLAIRVPAGLAGLDIQARKLEPSHGKARDVLVRHAQADRHAVEAAARVDGALELIDVLGTDEIELHQAREGLLQVRHFLGHQFQLVGGLVARDHLAVAVEDQPARRRDRLVAHPVTLGEVRVVFVAEHLQHEQPHDQADDRHRHDRGARQGALIEEALFPPVILDTHRRHGGTPQRPSAKDSATHARPREP